MRRTQISRRCGVTRDLSSGGPDCRQLEPGRRKAEGRRGGSKGRM